MADAASLYIMGVQNQEVGELAGRYQSKLKWSDVTPQGTYLNRRAMLAGGAALAGSMALPARASTELVPNPYEHITSYNNFY